MRENIKADAENAAMSKLSHVTNLVPVCIIGSGPAGLMAATYGARGGKHTVVIEGNKPGGLLMDTTDVENWPGETMIKGPEIISKLKSQAEKHGVVCISGAVSSIDTNSWPYRITLDNETVLHAMTIIIATGASPRRLGIPGEDTYWGSGVTSCAVCDAPFYKNEDVVVVGGGDSAIEEAIQLSGFARSITILVRKDTMRAAPTMQARLKQYPKISIQYNVEPKKIVGTVETITGIELYNGTTKETSIFPTSGVFLAIGHIPNSGFVKDIIKTDAEGYIIVNHPHQQTSVAGIFAAGDIADKIYRQAGTSSGHGIQAGLDAVRYLDDIGFSDQVAQSVSAQLYRPGAQMPHQASDLISITTLEELEALINGNPDRIILLDFWTETCSSCKQIMCILKELSKENDSPLIVSIDADEAFDLVEKFMITRAPTLIVLKHGIVAEKSGFLDRSELQLMLKKHK